MADTPLAHSPDAGSRFAHRRRFPRFAFDAQAEMSDPLIQLRVLGRVTEISVGGCFVAAPDPPAVSSVVQLVLEHNDESFSTWARVLYDRSGSGVGLRFIAIAPDQAKILATWLRALEGI